MGRKEERGDTKRALDQLHSHAQTNIHAIVFKHAKVLIGKEAKTPNTSQIEIIDRETDR